MPALLDLNYALSIPLSSLCAAPNRGWRMGVITAFFDASSKAHDPVTKWVALAGYFAPQSAWETFDLVWRKALGLLPYLHMSELVHSKGPFKGMRQEDKQILLSRVAGALSNLDAAGFGMYGVACVADKKAHERAKQRNPTIREISPECGEICFSHIFERMGLEPDDKVQVFYDREEQEFFSTILEDWDNKTRRRRSRFVSKLPVKPSPIADMREIPAAQAADFLAWHVYQSYAQDDLSLGHFQLTRINTKFVKMDDAYWSDVDDDRVDEIHHLY